MHSNQKIRRTMATWFNGIYIVLGCALAAALAEPLFKGDRQLLAIPELSKRGDTCAGIAGIQCAKGLVCKGATPNTDAVWTCIDDPCVCEKGSASTAVCGFDSVTETCKTYSSLCHMKCLGATKLCQGMCPQQPEHNREVDTCSCAPTVDAYVCATLTDEKGTRNVTYENACQEACVPESKIVDFGGPCEADSVQTLQRAPLPGGEAPVIEDKSSIGAVPVMGEGPLIGDDKVLVIEKVPTSERVPLTGAVPENEEVPVTEELPAEEEGCLCIELYDPVCGSDGNTYSNSCNAECAEVPIASKGECGDKI